MLKNVKVRALMGFCVLALGVLLGPGTSYVCLRPEKLLATPLGARVGAFREATGIQNEALEAVYKSADLNQSGKLSYAEIMEFQKRVMRTFAFQENPTVLRPDEFLAAGQGDCDDFAVFTAGLLRFYGWEPYVGALSNGNPYEGHAVCLSYEAGSYPKELKAFVVGRGMAIAGAKAGAYVPIDYEYVGKLQPGPYQYAVLVQVYEPEAMWGMEL